MSDDIEPTHEDREAWKERAYTDHYGMAGEATDWRADLRKGFAGFGEAIEKVFAQARAHDRRDGEEGYLAYATAWECAHAEEPLRNTTNAMRANRDWALGKVERLRAALDDAIGARFTVTEGPQRFGHGGWDVDGFLMIDSPVTTLVRHVRRLGANDRATGPILANIVSKSDGWFEAYTGPYGDEDPRGEFVGRYKDWDTAFEVLRGRLSEEGS